MTSRHKLTLTEKKKKRTVQEAVSRRKKIITTSTVVITQHCAEVSINQFTPLNMETLEKQQSFLEQVSAPVSLTFGIIPLFSVRLPEVLSPMP